MKKSRARALVVYGAAALGALLIATWLLRPQPWVPEPMPDIDMQCASEEAPVAWSFCINRTRGSANRDVLYHFHGRNGAATWWNDRTYYTGEVQDAWRRAGVAPPIVVAVSFGDLWLLTDELLPVFLETVMARVERDIGGTLGRRMLVGESMGGLNTLMATFKTTGLFTKAAALCAPLGTVSPYASLGELRDYVDRSSASWRRVAMMLAFSRYFFDDEEDWNRHDPVQLSRTYQGDTRLYISCGARDDWGCMEGSNVLVANLERNGRAVTWQPRPGGHCDIDAEALARFLSAP